MTESPNPLEPRVNIPPLSDSPPPAKTEQWGSQLGVIMAVAGSAVGLGNFLRFPGNAAQNGGGAFMVPYFIALLLVGIPMCWAEWTMGRYGGRRGFNSAPGIFMVVCRNKWARFAGIPALIVPMIIYMYYVVIESWCLAYAYFYLNGLLVTKVNEGSGAYGTFFGTYTGQLADMSIFDGGHDHYLFFVVVCFLFNFFLIYRGLSKGIETFCKIAMPIMGICAFCVLIRVLTLGPYEGRTINDGLGFMWNPDFSQLIGTKPWVAATGQIFFSLSVGFGVILNYASYLSKKDDVVLSGLTSCSVNEFFEVCLGGLITITAGFLFLGPAVGGQGTFGMGFVALPEVFARMPAGQLFGFLWFILLFLAAVTSSISMLQPVIAFLEEGFGLKRHASVAILGVITAFGSGLVINYSKNLTALDTLDYWAGTIMIITLAMIQAICYAWVMGIERASREMQAGASLTIPWFMQSIVLRFITPLYLIGLIIATCSDSSPGGLRSRIHEVSISPVAKISFCFLLVNIAFITLLIYIAGKRWEADGKCANLNNDDILLAQEK